MQALREIVKAKNHEIKIKLPDDFPDNEELEVIILPGHKKNVKEKIQVNETDIFTKDCGEFHHPINREYIYDNER